LSQDHEPSTDPEGDEPYEPPAITEIGTLAELTGNVGSGFVDFPQGSSIAG
jgi:hypothetical protein